ncbi:MAG: glycosyltransferase family 4 protein [Candidatus Scalindua sp.]
MEDIRLAMINIAILHYSCPPVVGGVEEIVRQQAFLLHRYYHPIKIIAGSGSQFTEDFAIEINPLLSSRNSEILQLQQNPTENHEGMQAKTGTILKYLKDSLKNFDILIAHNVLSMHYNLPLTLALHKLADTKTIKVINWNHDSPYFYKNYSKELERKHWLILKEYNPKIAYITISPSRAKEFQALYGTKKKINIIPNGIDPMQAFRLGKTTMRLIKENNLFITDLLMIQPARLHPRKNIELSIEVLRAFHNKGIKAKFLLSGAYDPHERKTLHYFNKLKDLAESLQVQEHFIILSDYVFESGEQMSADWETIRDLYQISDILFLPSKREGFGIPLLEAGMMKLPIACSDIESFKSIAGEDVFYFPLKDSPEKIAENVLEFLGQLRTHRMYRKVFCNYLWDNVYNDLLKPFLGKIANTSGSALN